MSTSQERKMEAQIARIKRDLSSLGAMRPGSISRQYRDPKEKRRPFWQISYTRRMKGRSEYVRPENLAALRVETANYRRFRRLVDRWVDVSLRLSQFRAKPAQTPKRADPITRERKVKKESAG
jgi:hypothetical protein